jgi:hypothetical protein
MITKTVTGSEPITLTQAKEYLQVDINNDDALITRLITMARENVEKICGVSIVETAIELRESGYYTPYLLPYGPVLEVVNIEIDGQEVEDAVVDEYVIYSGNRLEVDYIAGWAEVPQGLLQAVYELMKLYYDHRGQYVEVPATLINTLQLYSRNLIL